MLVLCTVYYTNYSVMVKKPGWERRSFSQSTHLFLQVIFVMFSYASVEKDKANNQAKSDYCEKDGTGIPISFEEIFNCMIATEKTVHCVF